MQPDPDSYRGCNLNTMSQEIEERIERIPLLRNFAHYLKGVRLNWLGGLRLYDLMELYHRYCRRRCVEQGRFYCF
jgi:hypothetical protein